MALIVEPLRQAELMAVGRGSIKNAPYLLPHVRELRPTSAVCFGRGHGTISDALRHVGVTRLHRYDPSVASLSRRPTGFSDLLICLDYLSRVPDSQVDAALSDMAMLARQAIIVVDTKAARPAELGEAAPSPARLHGWWEERLRAHFSYVEPIRVRSRRKAAFKTWPTSARSLPRKWFDFVGEEARYRLGKLGIGNA